jgi:hypothetical protein
VLTPWFSTGRANYLTTPDTISSRGDNHDEPVGDCEEVERRTGASRKTVVCTECGTHRFCGRIRRVEIEGSARDIGRSAKKDESGAEGTMGKADGLEYYGDRETQTDDISSRPQAHCCGSACKMGESESQE